VTRPVTVPRRDEERIDRRPWSTADPDQTTPEGILARVVAEWRVTNGHTIRSLSRLMGRACGTISLRETRGRSIPTHDLFALGDEAATQILTTYRERLRAAGMLPP